MNTDNLVSYGQSTTAQLIILLLFTINTMLISLGMDGNILIKKSKIISKSNRNCLIEKTVSNLTMKQNDLYCTFHSVSNGNHSYRWCVGFVSCLENRVLMQACHQTGHP